MALLAPWRLFGFEQRPKPGLLEFELDAFAWGYETKPGVSIPADAPEPGSLALLALGAVAALRRR